MSSYSVQALREKLSRLTNSQESIETLSLWIIHHKQNAASTVSIWFEDLCTCGDLDHQLVLLYVANDVLQNGRRRSAEVFQELFKEPMKEAFRLIRDTKITHSVTKMMKVWKERKVYSSSFIGKLLAVLEGRESERHVTPMKMRSLNVGEHGFKAGMLECIVSSMEKLESELAVKSSNVRNLRVDVADPSVLNKLKDKSEGGQFGHEIDNATHNLEEYSDTLSVEMERRVELLSTMMECRTATSRKLSEDKRLLAEYSEILKKAKELLTQLEARRTELQRAHSTATSDLKLAKTDIKEVGDMELDSGEEDDDKEAEVKPSEKTTAPSDLQPEDASISTSPKEGKPSGVSGNSGVFPPILPPRIPFPPYMPTQSFQPSPLFGGVPPFFPPQGIPPVPPLFPQPTPPQQQPPMMPNMGLPPIGPVVPILPNENLSRGQSTVKPNKPSVSETDPKVQPKTQPETKDGHSSHKDSKEKDTEVAVGKAVLDALKKAQSKGKGSLDLTSLSQIPGVDTNVLEPLLQKDVPKEEPSGDLTSKIGEVLVKSMSKKQSIKDVLDLWVKGKHSDKSSKHTDTSTHSSDDMEVTADRSPRQSTSGGAPHDGNKRISPSIQSSWQSSFPPRRGPSPRGKPRPHPHDQYPLGHPMHHESKMPSEEKKHFQTVHPSDDRHTSSVEDVEPPQPFDSRKNHTESHSTSDGGPLDSQPFRLPPNNRSFRPPPDDRPFRPPPDDRPFRPPPDDRPFRPPPDDRSFRPPPEDQSFRPSPDDRSFRPPPDDRSFRPPPDDRSFRPSPDDRSFRPPPDNRSFRPPPDDRAYRHPPDDRPFRPPPDDRTFRPPSDDRSFRPPPDDWPFRPTPDDRSFRPPPDDRSFRSPPDDWPFRPPPDGRPFRPPPNDRSFRSPADNPACDDSEQRLRSPHDSWHFTSHSFEDVDAAEFNSSSERHSFRDVDAAHFSGHQQRNEETGPSENIGLYDASEYSSDFRKSNLPTEEQQNWTNPSVDRSPYINASPSYQKQGQGEQGNIGAKSLEEERNLEEGSSTTWSQPHSLQDSQPVRMHDDGDGDGDGGQFEGMYQSDPYWEEDQEQSRSDWTQPDRHFDDSYNSPLPQDRRPPPPIPLRRLPPPMRRHVLPPFRRGPRPPPPHGRGRRPPPPPMWHPRDKRPPSWSPSHPPYKRPPIE